MEFLLRVFCVDEGVLAQIFSRREIGHRLVGRQRLSYGAVMQDGLRMVVGLGNPGKDYVGTRHNVGFEVLDHLAEGAELTFKSERKWKAHVATLPGSVILLKPQTYMNLSGRAVSAAMRFYKMTPEQILVVYDDVAFPLGTLKFRMSGSAGGHNGLRSMIADLGSSEFPRLKFGIGAAEGRDLSDYVLGKFREEEREVVQNTLATAVQAVQLALSQGVARAANTINESNKTTKKSEPEIRKPDRPEHDGE